MFLFNLLTPRSNQNDLTLQRAKNGSPDAFEELVTPFEKKMWSLCWHYTGRKQDAEDCLQEAMLKAWRSLPAFRGDCALSSWLYRITVSVCTDFLRRRKQNPSLDQLREDSGFDPPDPSPTPSEEAIQNDELRRLREAIRRLPPDQCDAVMLVSLQGMSCEDAAQVLGTAVGTVKSRINRAKKELLKLLQDDGTETSAHRQKK